VRTRTLLLLAVGCGLAILAAGVVFLLGLAGVTDDAASELAAVGTEVTVGDVAVTVTGYEERQAAAIVSLRIGGVEDPDGTDQFRLVVGDEIRAPADVTTGSTGGAPACGPVIVEPRSCVLTFELGDAPGGSRLLRYQRGDDSVAWELSA
jgi:hypothetical protein